MPSLLSILTTTLSYLPTLGLIALILLSATILFKAHPPQK